MKTIIAGGGIGGLVTALYLSHNQEDVLLLEKKPSLGGRIKFVEEAGFKIDEGPTIVLLPEVILSILEEAGVDRDKIPMKRLDPLYTMHFRNGPSFTKWSDTQKQLEEITRCFPGEEEHYLQFMHDMKGRFESGKAAFLENSFYRKRTFFTKENMSSLVKMKAYQNVKKQSEQYFSHPMLQQAFQFQTLYIGGHPSHSPALYSLVTFSEHFHGVWYIEGGYASLITVLEKELRERGVEIRLNEEVLQVDYTEDRQFESVLTPSGRMKADQLVLNGDFPKAKQLISKQKETSYEASSGCLLIYLGVDKIYKEEGIHQFFMGGNLDEHMEDVFRRKQLHDDPSIYVFNPTIMDDSLAPSGQSVLYMLIPVPSGTDSAFWENKEEYADKMIELVEARGYEGLSSHIIWKKVRTPDQAEADGLYKGGSFGIQPTLGQSAVFRPQLKPFKADNIYAVGASVHPGGGVPIVMQGARLLAQHLRHS